MGSQYAGPAWIILRALDGHSQYAGPAWIILRALDWHRQYAGPAWIILRALDGHRQYAGPACIILRTLDWHSSMDHSQVSRWAQPDLYGSFLEVAVHQFIINTYTYSSMQVNWWTCHWYVTEIMSVPTDTVVSFCNLKKLFNGSCLMMDFPISWLSKWSRQP